MRLLTALGRPLVVDTRPGECWSDTRFRGLGDFRRREAAHARAWGAALVACVTACRLDGRPRALRAAFKCYGVGTWCVLRAN